jgi:hypothetical protein
MTVADSQCQDSEMLNIKGDEIEKKGVAVWDMRNYYQECVRCITFQSPSICMHRRNPKIKLQNGLENFAHFSGIALGFDAACSITDNFSSAQPLPLEMIQA